MLKKIYIGLLILYGIGLVIFIGYMLMIVSAFGGFKKDYSVSDLKANFEKNQTEIYELKRYFNEIVPKNRFVEIEFSDDNTLFRFGIKTLHSTSGDPNGTMFLEWDLKINTQRMDSIIKPIGWTRETLKTLKDKLDKLIYWSWCPDIKFLVKHIPNKHFFNMSGPERLQTINNEIPELNDGHWSENSHKVFFERINKFIENFDNTELIKYI
jgi:hypothetical protein